MFRRSSNSGILPKKDPPELVWRPTEKHKTDRTPGTMMDLPDATAQTVLNNSVKVGKQRYGYYEGRIYEFKDDNAGGWHGYTIPGNEAPTSYLRSLLENGTITKAQYNKYIRGKL